MCVLVAGSQCIMETEAAKHLFCDLQPVSSSSNFRGPEDIHSITERQTHTQRRLPDSVQSGCIVNSCHLPSFHSARFRRYFTPCKQNVIAIHQYGNIKSQVLHVQKIDTGITFELTLTFIIYICRMIIQVSRSC